MRRALRSSPHDAMTKSPITWTAWFDGATEPNPGRRGIGGLLLSAAGERVEISAAIGHGTNNEAEYEALIAVLREAVRLEIKHLVICGDSQLVIQQVTGAWACKSPNLKQLCATAQSLLRQVNAARTVELRWIPREENTAADALSVAALGGVRETPEEKAAWTTPTEIGKRLGLSAIAVGKRLEALGYRENKQPTALAIDTGLVRITEDHFGTRVAWHIDKTLAVLQ